MFERLFVDVSYTCTQTSNIGVTRTVRRLFDEFQQLVPQASLCQAVAVHSSGFRTLAALQPMHLRCLEPAGPGG